MNELEQSVVNQAMNLLEQDCGSSICLFAVTKSGMRTNGPCRCSDRPGYNLGLIKLVTACKQLRLFHEKEKSQK